MYGKIHIALNSEPPRFHSDTVSSVHGYFDASFSRSTSLTDYTAKHGFLYGFLREIHVICVLRN